MIHKTEDNNYVISSGGTWLSGSYESERAAKYACRFNDIDLHKLQEQKNKTTGVITFIDLKELRKRTK